MYQVNVTLASVSKRKMCQVNPQETEEILRGTVIVEAAASSQEDNARGKQELNWL